ncbi:PLDc N-terminal domain-containing protein [Christiangramia echinicola]|uniref:PLDc N-terminal domain-containing protein n=1 Tax=Christiangramia echinicola TaxID=279359 RepID=UPI000424E047
MESIAFFSLLVLSAIFVIIMIKDLIENEISLLAKIIWLLVILSIPLLGATLYYITEKKPH